MNHRRPDFHRFLKAIENQIPDRVPLAELHIDTPIKEGFLGRKIQSPADEVEFWERAGYDFIPIAPPVDLNPKGVKGPIGLVTSAHQEGEERVWAPEKEGIITSMEDFLSFSFPEIEDLDFSIFKKTNDCLPEGMKIVGRYGYIFTHAWQLMGFETFAFSLYERRELIELLFERLGSFVYKIYERMASLEGVGALWYSDDLAYTEGLLVDPCIYREYVFPWLKKIGDLSVEKKMPLIMHSDGDLFKILDDLIDCGVKAIHPIEPKAMDIVEVRRRTEGRLALIGNIDLGYTLTRGTPQEVREEVRERIYQVGRSGGYCVGSSNSVTDYVPLENYKAMLEAVFAYGVYPLKV